jgi:hypothetical protein
MDAEGVYVFLILVLGGLFLLSMGTMALRGHFKGLYLIQGIPLVAPTSVIYTFFPGGFGALMLAIVVVIPNTDIAKVMIFLGGGLVMLSALVLMLWQPRWLKPQWLCWLEDNYPLFLHTLLEEARRAGKDWERQIKTQEDLEKWAERIVAKYSNYG